VRRFGLVYGSGGRKRQDRLFRRLNLTHQEEAVIMLGELNMELTGKRVVRRVLSVDPPKVEVSFEDSGKVLGVNVADFGTYTSAVRPDGSICGDGQGVMTTQEGEMIAWTGSGLGRFKDKGAVSYRGILYFRTASQKLARLNSVGGVFEYEVDPEGKTHTKVWEWK
jgi:hypothetical protein